MQRIEIQQGVLVKLVFASLLVFFLEPAVAQSNVAIGRKDSLHSKVLNETRELLIYVPAAAANDPSLKYPVIYLLDGDIYFHSFTGIVSHLSEVNSNAVIPDMIVVGIVNTDRTRDLTPTADTTTHMQPNGGDEKFTTFIEKELIPYIESRYPIAPYRMLTGHSLGGLLVVNILLKHPHLFNSYITLDPGMWWDNKRLLKESASLLKKEKYSGKSLFVAIGNPMQDGMDSIKARKDTTPSTAAIRSVFDLADQLRAGKDHKVRYGIKYYPGESHGSIPLISAYDALRFAFDFYKRPSFGVITDESPRVLESHYKTVSERMGYRIPPPEEMVVGLAWRCRVLDQNLDRAEKFLQLAEKYYPDSPGVYNEMALLYEDKKDDVKAKQYHARVKALMEALEKKDK